MAQGRAVDTSRCNFLPCQRSSLTQSYGQLGDNLWISYIKKKTKQCRAATRQSAAHKNPLRRLHNGRCECGGVGGVIPDLRLRTDLSPWQISCLFRPSNETQAVFLASCDSMIFKRKDPERMISNVREPRINTSNTELH